jgi:ribosomal-protein-alanine N-acetyltransferase
METAPDDCPEMAHAPVAEFRVRTQPPALGTPMTGGWREGLPTLVSPLCTLREVTATDAPSLHAHLYTEDVARFIPPPPPSVEAFEDLVRWAHLRRAQGRYVCFGVVPAGQSRAIGVFQVHLPDSESPVADWGFALGRAYWGTGIFPAGARCIRRFVFEQMGVRRLEARSVVQNGRANGALRKIGAAQTGTLQGAFEKGGTKFDHALWIITGASVPAAAPNGLASVPAGSDAADEQRLGMAGLA